MTSERKFVVYSLITQVLTQNHICLAYHKEDKHRFSQQTISHVNSWLKMCRHLECHKHCESYTIRPSSWMIWWLLQYFYQSNLMMNGLNSKSSTRINLILKHEHHSLSAWAAHFFTVTHRKLFWGENIYWAPHHKGYYIYTQQTYLLTPCCRVLLEKLTGLQLVKKFHSFHGTRRFITALTSVHHLSLSWASPFQSIYLHPTSWRSILILSTHLRLGLPSGLFPSGFPTKTPPLLTHTRHMPSPSHCSRFNHPHNIGWGVQII